MDAASIRKLGKRVLEIEARAITGLMPFVNDDFVAACGLFLACKGRIVVTGMGKSGHISGKIAATLASTGTPSFFVHPGEASHGDMGMITSDDVVLAVSNSGETAELLVLLPVIKRLGVPLVAMSGKPSSTLARTADVHMHIHVEEEACPLNLAPHRQHNRNACDGDALAVALLESRGFTAADFARSHPGGSLGRRLLLHVEDVMHAGDDVPSVNADTPVSAALLIMTRRGLGMTGVIDETGHLMGVFTDGDLRRTIDSKVDIHSTRIGDVMTTDCKTARPKMLAAEAVHIMDSCKITALPVTDGDNRLVGALNVHDLLRAGVM